MSANDTTQTSADPRQDAPPRAEAPMGELVKQLSEQTSQLVRQEVELAKAELAEKGKDAGAGAGMLGAGGILGLFGAAAVTTAVILALADIVPDPIAALIVGVVYLAGAAVLAMRGRDRVKQAGPAVPEQTIETVKEDVEWASNQAKSVRK